MSTSDAFEWLVQMQELQIAEADTAEVGVKEAEIQKQQAKVMQDECGETAKKINAEKAEKAAANEEGVADEFVLTNNGSFEHYATVNIDRLTLMNCVVILCGYTLRPRCLSCLFIILQKYMECIHIIASSSFLMSMHAQTSRFVKVITVVKVDWKISCSDLTMGAS